MTYGFITHSSWTNLVDIQLPTKRLNIFASQNAAPIIAVNALISSPRLQRSRATACVCLWMGWEGGGDEGESMVEITLATKKYILHIPEKYANGIIGGWGGRDQNMISCE